MEEILAEHGVTIGIAVGAVILGLALWKLLARPKKVFAEDMTLNVKCPKCGWQGTVTKYNQTCRKCNNKDLQSF